MVLRKNQKYFFILLTIVALAIFFRFWALANLPPGLYPDEAINGNQAISEPGKIFYPENNGREGLFINLLYLSFSFFGISIWSLKFVPAIIGVLTVFGLYLLTKEILRTSNFQFPISNHIALLSSFFLAVSFWHTNFSRISFRAILVPFCLVFLFYFLFRGFRTKKIGDFVLGGIFFGLGFHSYIAYRMIVFVVLLTLIFWLLVYQKERLLKKFFVFCFLFFAFALIVALPIAIYFLENPQDFIARATGVSIFASENPSRAFAKSLFSHLLMFNFWGDNNWRHNISGEPVLFWPVGILFLIGLGLAVKEIINHLLKKKSFLFLVSCFLILWWFFMLLPGILTIEGIPHSLRTIGAIPPTFIFAGIGGCFLWLKIKKAFVFKLSFLKKFILLIFLFILGGAFIFSQYYRYFWLWGKNLEVEGAFSKNYVELGNILNSFPENFKKYVIVNQGGVLVKGIPMPAQTVEFIERTKYRTPLAVYLLPEDILEIKIENRGTVIALMKYNEELLKELKEKFPKAILIYAQ